MALKIVVNNYTNEEKELMQWAKLWMEKQRNKASKGKRVVEKKH